MFVTEDNYSADFVGRVSSVSRLLQAYARISRTAPRRSWLRVAPQSGLSGVIRLTSRFLTMCSPIPFPTTLARLSHFWWV